LAGYLFTIAAEWLVFFFVWLGSRWGGASLRTLAGDFAPTWRSILRDLGLAVAFLYGTLAHWRRSLRPGMIAHTLGDAVDGLVLARYFLK
jgi:hypothetical protein